MMIDQCFAAISQIQAHQVGKLTHTLSLLARVQSGQVRNLILGGTIPSAELKM